MAEQKYTPGPWEAKRIDNSTGDTLYHCHLFVEPSVCGLYAPPGNETAEANARLIAAAPELLAALKGLMQVQDCEKDCWCDEMASHEEGGCEACMARIAIAKAEGGAT